MATQVTFRVFACCVWAFGFSKIVSIIAWVLGFHGIAGLMYELAKLAFPLALISGVVLVIVWLATSKKG